MKKYLVLLLVLGTIAAKAQSINPYLFYKEYEETTDLWFPTEFDNVIKDHNAEMDVSRLESFKVRRYDDSCLTKTIAPFYKGKGFDIDHAMSLIRTFVVNRCTRSGHALRAANIFIVTDAGHTYGILVFLTSAGWKIHAVDTFGTSIFTIFHKKLRPGLQIISAI